MPSFSSTFFPGCCLSFLFFLIVYFSLLCAPSSSRTLTKVNLSPWLIKYIFPDGTLPSLQQVFGAAEKVLVPEDMHQFGPDYAKTLEVGVCAHGARSIGWPVKHSATNLKYIKTVLCSWQPFHVNIYVLLFCFCSGVAANLVTS